MKKNGANMEFNDQRARELHGVMLRLKSSSAGRAVGRLYPEAVASPASRFWVSEERAVTVVAALLRGGRPLDGMREAKRRMYIEIAARVESERARRPGEPLVALVAEVIQQPAPEFYMTAEHARYILCNYKNRQAHDCRRDA